MPRHRGRDRTRRRPSLTGPERLERRSLLATFLVTSTADSGPGSLRQAILDANDTARYPGADEIRFDLPGDAGTARTIAVASGLPAITDPLTIDGTSQPDYSGHPLVQLDGSGAGSGAPGIEVDSGGSGSAVLSLAVGRFGGDGIYLNAASGVVIQGNYVGTDATGTAARGNASDAIVIQGGQGTTIGGTAADAGNLVSGNAASGVAAFGANDLVIRGNKIGTDVTGTVAIGNAYWGVYTDGTSGLVVGGTEPGAGNLSSGNQEGGIWVNDGTGSLVQGNRTGTDATGTAALGNAFSGILIYGGQRNTVGGTSAGAGNLSSGNGERGIWIGNGAEGTLVQGNTVGTDAAGTADLGNVLSGILISGGATDNTIGGGGPGDGNLVSGNSSFGVRLYGSGTSGNLVAGNTIGTDRAGAAPIANDYDGVGIQSNSSDNTIGGLTGVPGQGPGNLISGNVNRGVGIFDPGSSNNLIVGNLIGTDRAGTAPLGNGLEGVYLEGAGTDNVIGGDAAAGARNVVSGNGTRGAAGIAVFGGSDGGVRIQGNLIGTDLAGTAAIGNGREGVYLDTVGATIGGAAAGLGNVLSGNDIWGVQIGTGGGYASGRNLVVGNTIGTDVNGTAALGNAYAGIQIDSGTTANTIGGTGAGAGNLISGNGADGVLISGSGTMNNLVQGNTVGTDRSGTIALGNAYAGISVDDHVVGTTVGGTAAGAGNLISGNAGSGVYSDSVNNLVILGNRIGTDPTGEAVVGNGNWGIYSHAVAGLVIGGTESGAGNLVAGSAGGGIWLDGATGALVQGNRVGTDAAGTAALGNAAGYDGILVYGGQGNTIGGAAAGAGNLVSGNGADGIGLANAASGTLIQGNTVGTDVTGTVALGNAYSGVAVLDGSVDTTVGGTAVGAGNLISGNRGVGLYSDSAPVLLIRGNRIGTDAAGTAALGNGDWGMRLYSEVGLVIGGTDPGAGNLVSGNNYGGIWVYGGTGSLVQGNTVGTDAAGTAPLGNAFSGILIYGGVGNTVGGTAAGAGNLASANGNHGIWVANGASGTLVQGNTAGTDAAGTVVLGNALSGISIDEGASDTTVGGTAAGAGNLSSGNRLYGLAITQDAYGTLVQGNKFGTDRAGTAGIYYSIDGIHIDGAIDNTIGGTEPGAGNVIAGNAGAGIALGSSGSEPATGNLIVGNRIGTEASGTIAIGNGGPGIEIDGGAGNTIGGVEMGAGNVIAASGGGLAGIYLIGASGNAILGNLVGVSIDGVALPNRGPGVRLERGSDGNTIGGAEAGAGNVIAGNVDGIYLGSGSGNAILGNLVGVGIDGVALPNQRIGILLAGYGNTIGGAEAGAGNVIAANGAEGIYLIGASGNAILGNSIGVGIGGMALPNQGIGIHLLVSTGNTIGGAEAGAGNVIAGNGEAGILLDSSDFGPTSGNLIVGNLIGTDATGTVALGNGGPGIEINGVTDNTIGGAEAGAGNVIAGNGAEGVYLNGASGNAIVGNAIGVGIGGVALPNQGDGVRLVASSGNTVGGTADGAGNLIAYNTGAGVEVYGGGQDAILRNAIVGNAGGGIVLDRLANSPAVPPVLATAVVGGGSTTVRGTLAGAAGTTYRVEFFRNDAADPSGSGQGQEFLVALDVTIPAGATQADFSVDLGVLPVGSFVTATATDPAGDTSAFSNAVAVTAATPPAPVEVTGEFALVSKRTPVRIGRTTHFTTTLTIRYDGTAPLTGPFYLLLDGLTPGVTLLNRSGEHDGSPFLLATDASLAPGGTLSFTLLFDDPSFALITYGFRLFAGPGSF